MRPGMQFQMQMTPMVKKLIIVNVAIWLVLIFILQGMILGEPVIFNWFGVTPNLFFLKFHIWQPFTYMFLHSPELFHILFNMLILWMMGSELEVKWGQSFFLAYYLVCGLGAGLIYLIGALIVGLVSQGELFASPAAPMVGASGAVFGLLLAYGIIFSEKVVHFMMIFPMKAKYFVGLIGFIELITLLQSGLSNRVANLAHLGGIVTGFLFLMFWTNHIKPKGPKKTKKHGRNLKLVVNNESEKKDSSQPKYWN